MAWSCTYNATDGQDNLPRSVGTVHERIHQLENLVISLVRNEANSKVPELSPTPPNDTIDNLGFRDDSAISNRGFMKLSNSGATNYVGASHWSTVLDCITDLKDHLSQEEDRILEGGSHHHSIPFTSPLLYSSKSVTEAEILASIPPREMADRLVSRYFSLESTPGKCTQLLRSARY
jgi:hypothetical protein